MCGGIPVHSVHSTAVCGGISWPVTTCPLFSVLSIVTPSTPLASLSWLYILFCFLVKAFAAGNSFGASLFSELVFYLLIFQNVSLSKIQRKHAFSMANGLLPEGTPKGRALEPKHICAKTYMPCTHLQEGCLPLVHYTAAKSYKAHEYG